MKKALSLVLALVMVLSMAVVGFAADVSGTKYTAKISDMYYVEAANAYFVDIDVDPADDVAAAALEVVVYDAAGTPMDTGLLETVSAVNYKYKALVAVADNHPSANNTVVGISNFEKVTIAIKTGVDTDYYAVTYTKPVEVQKEVKDALDAAYKMNTVEVVIDAAKLDKATLNAADIAYITNTYKALWADSRYLGYEITVVNGKTIFDLGLIDYTWTKAINFTVTDGGIDADDYNAIRKLTGDTKNPFVFGFSGDAVPAGTEVDMVIPQAWINYYGHKNLTLFAWTAPITATYDNGANAGTKITMEDAKVLAETALDVNTTVTQRIQFTTDVLYKTLVLSANGLPVEDGAAVEDNKDANPNTGANDIVNVAVVFAVVSLAAAGALVCKKSK